MQNNERDDRKHVFVCGLGRSGTSVLGRNVARLENCTGFKHTGVIEDEGQFLQDVYPNDHAYGGAGRCGFDPRAHLTEASKLLTPESASRLRWSWEQYWDPSKTIRVEKTPSNLLMTRFLQAVFPNSYFIVIRRHPIPVSMATQKWKVSLTPLHSLFEHWLHCHELFEEDRKYLKHVYELSYEDYIEDFAKYHQEIAAFIGTRVPEQPKEDTFRTVAQWRNPGGLRVSEITMEALTGAHNQKYLAKWSYLLTKSRLKKYYQYIARKYEPRFARFGYSLIAPNGENLGSTWEAVRSPEWVGRLWCAGAAFHAFLWRAATRVKGRTRTAIRKNLPISLRQRVKALMRGTPKHPDKANVV